MRSTALLKSAIVHRIGTATGRKERCLIDQVGEIGASEARCKCRDLLGINVLCEFRPFHVDLEDLDPARLVGPVHRFAGQSARRQECRVEDLGRLVAAENHEASPWIETVELDQELVECLLPSSWQPA